MFDVSVGWEEVGGRHTVLVEDVNSEGTRLFANEVVIYYNEMKNEFYSRQQFHGMVSAISAWTSIALSFKHSFNITLVENFLLHQ